MVTNILDTFRRVYGFKYSLFLFALSLGIAILDYRHHRYGWAVVVAFFAGYWLALSMFLYEEHLNKKQKSGL